VVEACAYNVLTVPVAALLAAELVYRVFASTVTFAPARADRIARYDMRFHVALLALYVVHSVVFYF